MGKEIMHAVGIEADPAAVYQAVTTSKGLAAFWVPNASAEPREGAVATFQFSSAPVPLKMRIDELAENKRVVWTCEGDFPYWAGTSVSWELGPGDGGGTSIMFRHGGWPGDYPDDEFAKVNFTWGQVVAALKGYAETGTPQPALP